MGEYERSDWLYSLGTFNENHKIKGRSGCIVLVSVIKNNEINARSGRIVLVTLIKKQRNKSAVWLYRPGNLENKNNEMKALSVCIVLDTLCKNNKIQGRSACKVHFSPRTVSKPAGG